MVVSCIRESSVDRERKLESSLLEPTVQPGEGLPFPNSLVASLRTCMEVTLHWLVKPTFHWFYLLSICGTLTEQIAEAHFAYTEMFEHD